MEKELQEAAARARAEAQATGVSFVLFEVLVPFGVNPMPSKKRSAFRSPTRKK